MKIISMHKVDAAMEAGKLPSQELIQGMGQLMGEMRRASAFADGDGLRQSHTRARVRVKGAGPGPGQGVTVERGPYAGGNELVERLTRIRVKDMDEGIAWATRQAEATGAEVEVGPITEGWDLGLMAKPADAPLRCLLLQKGDPANEADRPAAIPALGALTAQMERAGVLLTAPTRLRPSREGRRISVAAGKPVFRDGPFAESKELIAGFVLLEVPGMPEAVEWALRFAKVIGDVELELRPLDTTA